MESNTIQSQKLLIPKCLLISASSVKGLQDASKSCAAARWLGAPGAHTAKLCAWQHRTLSFSAVGVLCVVCVCAWGGGLCGRQTIAYLLRAVCACVGGWGDLSEPTPSETVLHELNA